MTIQEKEQELINEFAMYDDWDSKYEYLIELGKELPRIDEKFKTDEFKIKGCQSQVWLFAEMKEDGKIYFTADSDALITKGIIALLVRVISGATPGEIIDCNMDFINKIGLHQHLSPTRSNGLVSMIKQIKLYALALKTKNQIL
ncbi:MAG: SufE family protein [Bacteroidota bacterium]